MIIDKLYKEKQADGTFKFFTLRKKFLGKLMDFDTKEEARFEKRHLKAYLKNHDNFTYDGMRFKTQYGVTVITLTEEEANKQKQDILDAIELANDMHNSPSSISSKYMTKPTNASEAKVIA